jgi:hypothetical protein
MRFIRFGIISVLLTGLTVFAQVKGHAQLVVGDSFAVLAQSGGSVSVYGGSLTGPTGFTGTYVAGDVGIGSGGSFSGDGGTLNGNLVFQDHSNTANYSTSGGFNVLGTVQYGNPNSSVSNALNAAINTSNTVGGYHADQTFYHDLDLGTGYTHQTQTITGHSGINVININGNLNINNGQLIFSGPADAVFYLNVSGSVSVNGGVTETINGHQIPVGIQSSNPGNVLINMTGNGQDFDVDENALVDGSVLNVHGSTDFGLYGAIVQGQVVSKSIDLNSAQVLFHPEFGVTPEGSSLAMFALGLLPVFVIRRRAKSSGQ